MWMYVCIYLSAYLTVCMRVCPCIRTYIDIHAHTYIHSSYAGIQMRRDIYI